MSRTLIVGEAGDGFSPQTYSGMRLAHLLGVTDVLEVFDVTNVMTIEHARAAGLDHTSPVIRGMLDGYHWDAAIARKIGVRMRLDGYERVLACGRKVERALMSPDEPYLPMLATGHGITLFPHPSGRSRWWNDESNLKAARTMLRVAASMEPRRRPPPEPRCACLAR